MTANLVPVLLLYLTEVLTAELTANVLLAFKVAASASRLLPIG